MRTVKRGDKYDGKPGEVVTLVLPQDRHIVAVLAEPGDFSACFRCPLFSVLDGCNTYLSKGICCSPLEDAVE